MSFQYKSCPFWDKIEFFNDGWYNEAMKLMSFERLNRTEKLTTPFENTEKTELCEGISEINIFGSFFEYDVHRIKTTLLAEVMVTFHAKS